MVVVVAAAGGRGADGRGAGLMGGRAEKLTLSDLVVMAMLSERPTHGYDLWAELERRDVADWAAVSRAQVYYSLKKLAGLGLIAAAGDGARAAGPEREKFRVSAAGRRAFGAALSRTAWAEQRPPAPFHTWLALATMEAAGGEAASRASVLEARARFLDRQIERETRTLEAIRADPGPTQAMAMEIVSHAIAAFRLEREFLGRVAPLLGAGG